MGITVLKHNAPWGPFNRAQIEEGLGRGDFTLKYLAHAPGLKEWLPLGEVLHFVEAAAPLPPVPTTRDLPPVPSPEALASARPLAIPLPPPIQPAAREDAPEPPPFPTPPAAPVAPQSEIFLQAASFIPRAFAFGIDCAVLFVPILLFFALGALTTQAQGWWQRADPETMRQEWLLLHRNFDQLLFLIAVGLGWLYAAGLESSRWQATIGKQWMGMKVTDAEGRRISFLRATGRLLAKYLSALPCFLGFMMALFSSRGLALHDRLAGTRVVRE